MTYLICVICSDLWLILFDLLLVLVTLRLGAYTVLAGIAGGLLSYRLSGLSHRFPQIKQIRMTYLICVICSNLWLIFLDLFFASW